MDTYSDQKMRSSAGVISWLLALIYSLTIMIVEITLVLGIHPEWGALIYGLMLLSLIVVAALMPEDRLMLIGFTGVPIVRIVTYGIPFLNTTLTVYFGVTGLILLFYVIPALRILESVNSRILKIPRNWSMQLFIIAGGFVVGFCQFLVFPPEVLYFSSLLELATFIAALLLLAFVEEVIFRGIALGKFANRFSNGMSVVFVAFIYACLFISSGSVELVLVMFFASLFYGFATISSSSLYGVIGAHFVSSLLYYYLIMAKL